MSGGPRGLDRHPFGAARAADPGDALRAMAARFALGDADVDGMAAAIDRALDDGLFVEAFIDAVHPDPHDAGNECARDLASASRCLTPSASSASPISPIGPGLRPASSHGSGLRGIPSPDRDTAIRALIRIHVERISDDRRDARFEGARPIDSVDQCEGSSRR